MQRHEKKEFVKALSSSLVNANLAVLVRQSGMNVSETQDLRQKMRMSQAHFKVAKNTLIKIAVEDTRFNLLIEHLKGPTAIAFSQDPIAAAKVICEYADSNDKIEVIGGVMGNQFLNAAAIQALAKLPSLDVLRAKLVGLIQAPATKVARVIQAPAGQMARLFSAYANKS